MGELLLELLSEEVPARMQRRAIEDLVKNLKERLQAERIAPAGPIRGYVTPRRLVVIADGIPARQPDGSEEKRGPRIGSPQPAIDGFLRSVGLTSIDQCEVRDDRYFAVIKRAGRKTIDVLPDVIHAVMVSLSWPKSMRFPSTALRWVRPINSVICLFDGEVVAVPLEQIPVGRTTRGHRFLSAGEIAVDNAADYLRKLEAAHVVLDHGRRSEMIAAGIACLAQAAGLTVTDDPALLDEVAGLVEYPVVLMGTIDDEFVQPLPQGLPPEVLATAMRTHQKYFSCLNPDSTPAPRFLFVANNLTADHGKTIIAGNERVLRARLADARFFWDQDRKVRLEDRVEALKQRVYYDRLGTMYDKTERMERLAAFLADHVPGVDTAGCLRAAHLAKADLTTGMVGEFPELQGVMGRYYALNGGKSAEIANAIVDHYKPLGPGDACPTAPISVVVALADKIDALVGFYGIGETPTGSRDPYALRRAALGVARLIISNNLRLSLREIFGFSYNKYPTGSLPRPMGRVSLDVLTFIVDRVKIHLRSEGVRPDFIDATLFREARDHDDDLVRILARQAALATFLDTDDGANLLIAYKRASNIVRIEQAKDQQVYDEDGYQPLSDRPPAEATLAQALNQTAAQVNRLIAHDRFQQAMGHLATLRQPVDAFFDAVTVNTDDAGLRENRLRLLSRIRAVMNQVADFSQIEG